MAKATVEDQPLPFRVEFLELRPGVHPEWAGRLVPAERYHRAVRVALASKETDSA